MNNIKILVSDDVSESGLEPLRAAGFTVDKKTGMKVDELCELVRDYDGLVVRSETKVTLQVMDAAKNLRAIGRAGVGVDNINVPAATQRGIVVMNAPDGNTMTTAEHTLALLLSLARRVPQGHASLRNGRWERKKFVGVELRGKTLGIIGLGRIGKVVASRARGFEMRIVAFDPFISPEQARELEIELAPLEDVFAQADFLTIHTPLTNETRGVVNAQQIARMKKSAYIINCARGGLVDENALYDALTNGKIAGAALDVFAQEPPPTDHPLLSLDNVIITPHLGASTKEAQEGVAVTVAEQMRDYFLTGALRGAVNVPTVAAQELNALQPYLALAEKIGRFQAQLIDDAVRDVTIEYAGELASKDASPVTRSFLAGLLRDMSARVNPVNAMLIAEERGIAVTTSYRTSGAIQSPAITVRATTKNGEHKIAGTLFTSDDGASDGRITEINNFRVEAIPSGHILVIRNRDVPGVIGHVGMTLGARRVNISRFQLGRQERGGDAVSIIETDTAIDDATLDELRTLEPVTFARRVELGS